LGRRGRLYLWEKRHKNVTTKSDKKVWDLEEFWGRSHKARKKNLEVSLIRGSLGLGKTPTAVLPDYLERG
jgi:hypothetical protein